MPDVTDAERELRTAAINYGTAYDANRERTEHEEALQDAAILYVGAIDKARGATLPTVEVDCPSGCLDNTGWQHPDGTFVTMMAGEPCPDCGGTGKRRALLLGSEAPSTQEHTDDR